MNICLVSATDVMQRFVMEHFAFPGNIDFATDDQGTFSSTIHETGAPNENIVQKHLINKALLNVF